MTITVGLGCLLFTLIVYKMFIPHVGVVRLDPATVRYSREMHLWTVFALQTNYGTKNLFGDNNNFWWAVGDVENNLCVTKIQARHEVLIVVKQC